MAGSETKCLGICQRLFNSIMKGLHVQAVKKSILGSPTNHGKVDTKSSKIVHPLAHGTSGAKPELEKTNSSKSSNPSSSSSLGSLLQNDRAKDDKEVPSTQAAGEGDRAEEGSTKNDRVKDDKEVPSTQAAGEGHRAEEGSAIQSKAPKKMVSINDRVEDIHKAMKKRKKSKSFDKSNSFMNGEDESKPLRPILKVASDLDEQTCALVNPSGT